MYEEIIKLASNQGIWALLFVFLLLYVLRETSRREKNYQAIIDKLSDKLDIVDFIKRDVEEIKDWISR